MHRSCGLTYRGQRRPTGEFYAELFGWTVGPGAGGYEGWIMAGGQPWAGITPGRAGAADGYLT